MAGKPGRRSLPYHRVKHGTETGYQWHYKHKDDPCPACVKAHQKYNRDYAKRRRRLRNALRWILWPNKRRSEMPSNAEMDEMIRELRDFLSTYMFLPPEQYLEPEEQEAPQDETPPERDHDVRRLPPQASLPVYPQPRTGRKFNPPPDGRAR